MNRLQKKIEEIGIDNCMFIVDFQPVHTILGLISYTSDTDEYIKLPAIIVEDRYKISDGYKITLKCLIPEFGQTHFYQTDLMSIIDNGDAELYKKEEI